MRGPYLKDFYDIFCTGTNMEYLVSSSFQSPDVVSNFEVHFTEVINTIRNLKRFWVFTWLLDPQILSKLMQVFS